MKTEILRLRSEGKTYNEIVRILKCSKATVSYHCGIGQKEATSVRRKKFRSGLAGKPKQKIQHGCLNCSGKVRLNISKYCSHSCQFKYEHKIFIEKWLKNEVQGYSGKAQAVKARIRRYLLELNNYSCSICGWNKRHPVDNKPLVEVDHIDGDSSNTFFNNLRVLCPNCHAETPTFRNRNKSSNRLRK